MTQLNHGITFRKEDVRDACAGVAIFRREVCLRLIKESSRVWTTVKWLCQHLRSFLDLNLMSYFSILAKCILIYSSFSLSPLATSPMWSTGFFSWKGGKSFDGNLNRWWKRKKKLYKQLQKLTPWFSQENQEPTTTTTTEAKTLKRNRTRAPSYNKNRRPKQQPREAPPHQTLRSPKLLCSFWTKRRQLMLLNVVFAKKCHLSWL